MPIFICIYGMVQIHSPPCLWCTHAVCDVLDFLIGRLCHEVNVLLKWIRIYLGLYYAYY